MHHEVIFKAHIYLTLYVRCTSEGAVVKAKQNTNPYGYNSHSQSIVLEHHAVQTCCKLGGQKIFQSFARQCLMTDCYIQHCTAHHFTSLHLTGLHNGLMDQSPGKLCCAPGQ